MANQNILFDGYIDRTRTQYASHVTGPQSSHEANSYIGSWGTSSVTPPINAVHSSRQPISHSHIYPHPFTVSNPSPSRSYPSPPYTPTGHSHRRASNPNCAGHPVMQSRFRSNEDIVNSMLTPVSAELPRTATRDAGPSSRDRVSWERSGPHSRSAISQVDVGLEMFHWPPQSEDQSLNLDSGAWDDAFSSLLDPSAFKPYQASSFPSNMTSVSLPLLHQSHLSDTNHQLTPASSTSSRGRSVDASAGKMCSHCHATTTPLWRREPTTLKPLCNACGLYLQQRNRHRPQELIEADAAADDSSDGSDGDGTGPECSHCHTHHTSVWRRSKTGAQLCNACGVYVRLRGKDRPLSLKRNKIKPRTKHTPRNE